MTTAFPPLPRLPSAKVSSRLAPQWICCQLGAREHYAIPRALLSTGSPCSLLTDAWVPPGNAFGKLNRSLGERYHASLAETPTTAWNAGLIAFELLARARRLRGWNLIIARNRWFQKQVVRCLTAGRSLPAPSSPLVVFAYSYAAREIFRWAKTQGWRTVLGQIDPGPVEERIVANLHKSAVNSPSSVVDSQWHPAPAQYWELWKEECELADVIIVNSKWSEQALLEEGIPREKLVVIPLCFEAERSTSPRPFLQRGEGEYGVHRSQKTV